MTNIVVLLSEHVKTAVLFIKNLSNKAHINEKVPQSQNGNFDEIYRTSKKYIRKQILTNSNLLNNQHGTEKVPSVKISKFYKNNRTDKNMVVR